MVDHLSEYINKLSIPIMKVTDIQLSKSLETLLNSYLELTTDIKIKTKECYQSQSFKPLVGSRNIETIKKVMHQVSICNRRIEELLSGYDTKDIAINK